MLDQEDQEDEDVFIRVNQDDVATRESGRREGAKEPVSACVRVLVEYQQEQILYVM